MAMSEEMEQASNALEEAYALDPADFMALKAAQRETILFMLVRDMAGNVRSLLDIAEEIQDKAKEIASPEGIQTMLSALSSSGGMLGMLAKGFTR